MNKLPSEDADNPAEEQDFWAIHDSADYMDWLEQPQQEGPPAIISAVKTVPLHLPQALWDALQAEAGLRDMPCQALIESWLKEKLEGA